MEHTKHTALFIRIYKKPWKKFLLFPDLQNTLQMDSQKNQLMF